MPTSIQISDELRKELVKRKFHDRETYEEVIRDLLEDSRELGEETRRELAEARAEIKAGRSRTLAEVKRELGQ
ncbi:MAG: hypothetical protein L0Z54_06255 [Thermoplasmata archaeon]|nr:hypothetical protein [Thermoplasmata archaeon]